MLDPMTVILGALALVLGARVAVLELRLGREHARLAAQMALSAALARSVGASAEWTASLRSAADDLALAASLAASSPVESGPDACRAYDAAMREQLLGAVAAYRGLQH